MNVSAHVSGRLCFVSLKERGKSDIRILHIITSLEAGGAQAMLYKLIERFPGTSTSHSVIQLAGGGVYTERFRKLGIPVHSLGLRASRPSLRAIRMLRNLVNELRPELIQGWMYHGNLAAEIAKTLCTDSVLTVWNIRHSIDSMSDEKAMTRWVIRLGARLSQRPVKIVYNSSVAAVQHELLGYNDSTRVIIANGFDIDRFQYSPDARDRLRSNLGLAHDSFVVGMVARNHPMKDHTNLIESAILLINRGVNIQFLLAGAGTDSVDALYGERLNRTELATRFHLLGEFDDIPGLMSTIDVLVLSSAWGEGFPNVLGEAMACERPCVATNVGDCAAVLGDCGIVVPPKNSLALAAAIQRVYSMSMDERRDIGLRARLRVERNFALPGIVNRYWQLYESMLGR